MKQQRFCSAFGWCVLTAVVLTYSASNSYAGPRPGTTTRPLVTVPRAFLSLDSRALAQPEPLTRISSSNNDHTMETLARISVVGGLLLTADRLVRSMDSIKDAPLLLRDDGSCLRVSTVNKDLLVGFTMSRPLDF